MSIFKIISTKTSVENQIIPSINFHLWEPCNMRCKFCFATFKDVKQTILPQGHLPQEKAIEVVQQLAAFGFTKITFAGGEPTLCPWLPELMATAKSLGMTTMIVTNGSKLTDEFLEANKQHLDWIAISIDSLNQETNLQAGRAISGSKPLSLVYYKQLIEKVKAAGYGLKINTVVHRLNVDEDFLEFIRWAKPKRWKVLQVLSMEGQNETHFKDLELTNEAFQNFVDRHKEIESITEVVFEDVDAIKGSYAMVDPAGRFFDNVDGRHTYSQPILEVGCAAAYQQVRYDVQKFENRGGNYNWKKPVQITLSGKVASGKSSVGKLLAERLGYSFTSIGNQSRKEAESRGLSIAEFQQLCLNTPGMDEQIDIAFSKACHKMSGLVIDYRLGFHFIQDAFHVYLDISDELALERIGNANRVGDDAGTLAKRNETFKQQFLQAYNLDYTQLTHYDLVVSITPEKTLQDIVNEILQAIYK